MSSNLEEGITPAELGGMGPVQLPTDTQLGSGDIPSGIKSKEDEEDEKKKLKEMEGKLLYTSFNDFVSEARDLNDPMAMRLRAAKSKADKKKSEPAKKEMSPAKAKKLAKLQDERAQIMRDMEQEAEMEGGSIADHYGKELEKIDKQIAKLTGKKEKGYKLTESEDPIFEMDSEGIQSLADELNAEVYTARLKDGAKSATIKATTTTKTWDDGAPILKFLARGKAKSMPFALYQRPFTVLHDVAHGWFYFTDGRKWYGLHGDEGYSEPEDLPFNMEISESIVSERYVKSAGYKSAVDRIEGLSRQLDPMSRLCKGISKGADNVVPEFKEMEKHMEEIISIWNEIEMIIDMNEAVVTEGAFVVWYEDQEGKHLLGTFRNKKAAEKYKSEEEDEMLNTKGVESVGMMSKDMWDKKEAPYIKEDVNEARSINKIQKEYSKVINDMANKVASWKDCKSSGDTKGEASCLADLKELTSKKKALMSELDAAVGIKDLNIELAD